MRARLNKKSVIWIWLISYLLVLAFPLLASYFLYRFFITSTMENTERLNSIALSQTSAGVESVFIDIRNMGSQILSRPEALSISFSEKPLTIHKIERFGSFQTRLRDFILYSDYLRNIYVYFNELGLTASTEGMFGNESLINHLSENLNIDSETLSSWIYGGENFQVRMVGAAYGSFQATQIMIIMSQPHSYRTTLIFIADSRALRRILAEELDGISGELHYLWAVSPDEGLTISNSEAQALAKEIAIDFGWSYPEAYKSALNQWDMTVKVTESPLTGWLLVSAIPMGKYTSEMRVVGQVYLVFLLVSVTIGAAASAGLSVLNYRPLSRLSTAMENFRVKDKDTSNEFEYLENSLTGLIRNTQEYETELERQRALLAKSNLVKVLRGTLYTEQAFATFCRDYKFVFSTDSFMVICVNIRDYDITRITDSESLVDDELYANSIDIAEDIVGSFLEGLLQDSADCYHCFYDGYTYLILARKTVGEESEADFIQKIIDVCTKGGALVKDRFGIEADIYISNVHSGSHGMIRKAYLEAKQGVEQMEGLQVSGKSIEIYENSVVIDKPGDSEPLSSVIVKFINENYSNPDLNVASVADNFGFSSSYLLRVFKKDMNCGVLDYIRRQRVDAAKTLLRDTSKTVAEVAELTGHSNALALIRAFKHLEGITPTNYRNLMNTQV